MLHTQENTSENIRQDPYIVVFTSGSFMYPDDVETRNQRLENYEEIKTKLTDLRKEGKDFFDEKKYLKSLVKVNEIILIRMGSEIESLRKAEFDQKTDYGPENESDISLKFGSELQEFVISVGNLFNQAAFEFIEEDVKTKLNAAQKLINLLTEMLQAFLDTSQIEKESEIQLILKLALTYVTKIQIINGETDKAAETLKTASEISIFEEDPKNKVQTHIGNERIFELDLCGLYSEVGMHKDAQVAAQLAIENLSAQLNQLPPSIQVDEGPKKVGFKEESDPLVSVKLKEKKQLLSLAHFNLGVLFEHQEMFEEAVQNFRQACLIEEAIEGRLLNKQHDKYQLAQKETERKLAEINAPFAQLKRKKSRKQQNKYNGRQQLMILAGRGSVKKRDGFSSLTRQRSYGEKSVPSPCFANGSFRNLNTLIPKNGTQKQFSTKNGSAKSLKNTLSVQERSSTFESGNQQLQIPKIEEEQPNYSSGLTNLKLNQAHVGPRSRKAVRPQSAKVVIQNPRFKKKYPKISVQEKSQSSGHKNDQSESYFDLHKRRNSNSPPNIMSYPKGFPQLQGDRSLKRFEKFMRQSTPQSVQNRHNGHKVNQGDFGLRASDFQTVVPGEDHQTMLSVPHVEPEVLIQQANEVRLSDMISQGPNRSLRASTRGSRQATQKPRIQSYVQTVIPPINEAVGNKLSSDFNSPHPPKSEANHFYHSFEQQKPKTAVASSYLVDQLKRKKTEDEALQFIKQMTNKQVAPSAKDQKPGRPSFTQNVDLLASHRPINKPKNPVKASLTMNNFFTGFDVANMKPQAQEQGQKKKAKKCEEQFSTNFLANFIQDQNLSNQVNKQVDKSTAQHKRKNSLQVEHKEVKIKKLKKAEKPTIVKGKLKGVCEPQTRNDSLAKVKIIDQKKSEQSNYFTRTRQTENREVSLKQSKERNYMRPQSSKRRPTLDTCMSPGEMSKEKSLKKIKEELFKKANKVQGPFKPRDSFEEEFKQFKRKSSPKGKRLASEENSPKEGRRKSIKKNRNSLARKNRNLEKDSLSGISSVQIGPVSMINQKSFESYKLGDNQYFDGVLSERQVRVQQPQYEGTENQLSINIVATNKNSDDKEKEQDDKDCIGIGGLTFFDSNVPCTEQTILDLKYLSLIHGVCTIELVSIPVEQDSHEVYILLRARQVSDPEKPQDLFTQEYRGIGDRIPYNLKEKLLGENLENDLLALQKLLLRLQQGFDDDSFLKTKPSHTDAQVTVSRRNEDQQQELDLPKQSSNLLQLSAQRSADDVEKSLLEINSHSFDDGSRAVSAAKQSARSVKSSQKATSNEKQREKDDVVHDLPKNVDFNPSVKDEASLGTSLQESSNIVVGKFYNKSKDMKCLMQLQMAVKLFIRRRRAKIRLDSRKVLLTTIVKKSDGKYYRIQVLQQYENNEFELRITYATVYDKAGEQVQFISWTVPEEQRESFLEDKCDFLTQIARKNLEFDKDEPGKLCYVEEQVPESSESSKLTNKEIQDIPDLTFHSSKLDVELNNDIVKKVSAVQEIEQCISPIEDLHKRPLISSRVAPNLKNQANIPDIELDSFDELPKKKKGPQKLLQVPGKKKQQKKKKPPGKDYQKLNILSVTKGSKSPSRLSTNKSAVFASKKKSNLRNQSRQSSSSCQTCSKSKQSQSRSKTPVRQRQRFSPSKSVQSRRSESAGKLNIGTQSKKIGISGIQQVQPVLMKHPQSSDTDTTPKNKIKPWHNPENRLKGIGIQNGSLMSQISSSKQPTHVNISKDEFPIFTESRKSGVENSLDKLNSMFQQQKISAISVKQSVMTTESHEENHFKSQQLRSQVTAKAEVADNIAIEPFNSDERPIGEFVTGKFAEANFNEYMSSSNKNSVNKKVAVASLDLSPVLQRHNESEEREKKMSSQAESQLKESSFSSSLTQQTFQADVLIRVGKQIQGVFYMITALKVHSLNQLLFEVVDHEKVDDDDQKMEYRIDWKGQSLPEVQDIIDRLDIQKTKILNKQGSKLHSISQLQLVLKDSQANLSLNRHASTSFAQNKKIQDTGSSIEGIIPQTKRLTQEFENSNKKKHSSRAQEFQVDKEDVLSDDSY